MLHKKHLILVPVMVLCVSLSYAQNKDKFKSLPVYTSLEEALKTPDKVYRLNLAGKGYTVFPEDIFRLKNLRWLDLGWKDKKKHKRSGYGKLKNHLKALPAKIAALKHLEYLDLSYNRLTKLPAEIGLMQKLKYLKLGWNNLLALPKETGCLSSLTALHLTKNRLTGLPKEIAALKKLTYISLGENLFENFPETLLQCKKLRVLQISNNPIGKIPTNLGDLPELRRLYLYKCFLKILPSEIGQLKKLEILSVHDNQIGLLPETIGQLSKLRLLSVHHNLLTRLPKTIGQLSALKTLRAGHNHLRYLPRSIGQLEKIKTLRIGANWLKELPKEMMKLKKLDFFDISKNDSLKVNPVFFGWLSQNFNGLSSAIAEVIHEATLKKLKQQAQKQKEKQRLQNTKKFQFYALVFLGTGVCITFVFGVLIARSAYRQRIAKHRLRAQANTLQGQNSEIEAQAIDLQKNLEKLKELQEFKQKMTAMITHDLKNPLDVVIGLSDLPASDKNKAAIYQAGLCMNGLIMNMLDVQKFRKTGMSIVAKPHALQTLVSIATEQTAWFAQSKNLTIRSWVKTHTGVQADKDLVIRLLVNLLNNAIKYSGQNQEIFIEAEQAGSGQVKIVVTDRGEGIPEQQLKHIFDEYHQVNACNLGQSASTGLGLAFCKLAAEAHGGNIGAKSMPGRGAAFWFTLPTTNETITFAEKHAEVPQTDWKPNLNEEEKRVLAPYLPLLRNQMVYQYSKIEAILSQMVVNENTGLATWKNALEEAMEACNEEMYEQLTSS